MAFGMTVMSELTFVSPVGVSVLVRSGTETDRLFWGRPLALDRSRGIYRHRQHRALQHFAKCNNQEIKSLELSNRLPNAACCCLFLHPNVPILCQGATLVDGCNDEVNGKRGGTFEYHRPV
jgi:hypothetical protein